MSTSLFDLVGEYRAAAEYLADLDLDAQTVADTLEGLSGELEVKAQNVAYVALNFEAAAEAIKAHAAKQTARAKALNARAEALRDYLARSMDAVGMQKIEGPGVKMSFRKSSAVAIDGEDLIPDEYMRQPETPPPAPDKVAIAAAIKAGIQVPGAHMEQRKTLVIA